MRAGRYRVYNAPYGRSIRPAARPVIFRPEDALKAVSLYVDSSVLLKRDVDVPDSGAADALLAGDARFYQPSTPVEFVAASRMSDERVATAAQAAFFEEIGAFGSSSSTRLHHPMHISDRQAMDWRCDEAMPSD